MGLGIMGWRLVGLGMIMCRFRNQRVETGRSRGGDG